MRQKDFSDPLFFGTLCIMWCAVRILSTISDTKRGLYYCASCWTLEHWSQVYLHILKPRITKIAQYPNLWSCLRWALLIILFKLQQSKTFKLNWIWHYFQIKQSCVDGPLWSREIKSEPLGLFRVLVKCLCNNICALERPLFCFGTIQIKLNS